MHGPEPGGVTPQFETVEYTASAGNCVLCNQPLGSTYYRVNGAQACAICVEREQTAQRESARYYPRALLFGIGAAILGLIGYATFEIATGWIIGYVSVGVGWLVGKAMLKGSKGMGGRKYQITAVALTYAAVSLAAIPVMISQIAKEKKEHPPVQAQQRATAPSQQATEQQPSTSTPDNAPSVTVTPNSGEPNSGVSANGNADSSQADELTSDPARREKEKMSFGKAIGLLVLIGLASPFLELSSPISGIIGLFILFIGMQIAWKITARPKLIIDGPY